MAYLKLFIFFLIFLSVATSCNLSNKNVNNSTTSELEKNDTTASFSGKFFGITPCADCPGIETTVYFNPDSTFVETLKYQERNSSFSDTGRWSISDSLITISFSKGTNERFFLVKSDSSIAMLDADKKEINGPLASFYILKRKE